MNIKIKSFIITVIICIVFSFLYVCIRDSYIIKQNENYEINEYTFTEKEIQKEQEKQIDN